MVGSGHDLVQQSLSVSLAYHRPFSWSWKLHTHSSFFCFSVSFSTASVLVSSPLVQQVAAASFFSVPSSDLHSHALEMIFSYHLCIIACSPSSTYRALSYPRMNWVTVLDRIGLSVLTPPLAPTLLSPFPPAPFFYTLLSGRCCHGTMWPEWGFTPSILCSLHRGQLTRLRCADAKHTVYESSRVWTAAQDSAALSHTRGVSSPSRHSAEGQSSSWPHWVTLLSWFTSSCPAPFDQLFFFFSLSLTHF